jgi:hypothetical protein
LKLAALLTEYLLSNKKLDLPGIGTFRISAPVNEEKEITRHTRPGTIDEITFENDPSVKEVPDLINFLCSRSGKMKALIAADLDSHLTQAKQFINIGKPFLFEGIGSLSKLNSGEYEFVSEKIKDTASKEINITSSSEESFTGYRNIFSPGKAKAFWKKPVLIIFILSGLGIAVWLGYIVYKNSTADKPLTTQGKNERTIPAADSVVAETDSSLKNTAKLQPGALKYIIEIASKNRAFERFDRLKSYGWDIQMETTDSVEYKLFLTLRVPAEDTAWVVDSLTALNGRKVYIEN